MLILISYNNNMKNVITAFKEHKNFMSKRPWDSNIQVFPTNNIVPPHYAETIEVLLCCNVKGSINIGGKNFLLGGKQVFFIAPTIIHSINYIKSDGFVNVIKINNPEIKPILDLDKVLSLYDKTMLDLPLSISNYDEICEIVSVFSSKDSINEILQAILKLFRILILYSNDPTANYLTSSNTELGNILAWTEKNFFRKISIDEVALALGYEKHYFCYKFKKLTGITYLSYLNNLKINHACKMLKNGSNISQTCEACGFDNVSYFIQLFKKIIGTTPKKYITMLNV